MRGENADPYYYRLDMVRGRGFGGTSYLWDADPGVRVRPLDEIDFTPRPEIGRGGWPFTFAEMQPWYARAHEVMGLHHPDYRAEAWEEPCARRLPLPEADAGSTTFQFAGKDVFTSRLRELRRSRHVRVFVHATALELETDPDAGNVTAVRVAAGSSERSFAVKARIVVLAAGGIENARLLLLSNVAQPRGLGNAHDQVGRYFMEHPHARTGVVRPQGPQWLGRVAFYEVRRVRDTPVSGMLTLPAEVLRREGLANSAWWIRVKHPAVVSDAGRCLQDLLESLTEHRRVSPATADRLRTVLRHPVTASAALHARLTGDTGGSAGMLQLAVMSEQLPHPDSRVTLGTRRDVFARPVARLDWRLTGADLSSIRRTQNLLDRALRRGGIGAIEQRLGEEQPETLWGGGSHHMGTTRMHPDRASGVVDVNCRVHGVANLYIAGSSVFPTGGYANPTLTIVALASRLADTIRRRVTGPPAGAP